MLWTLDRDLGFPVDLVELMLEPWGVRVDRQQLLTQKQQQVKQLHSLFCAVVTWRSPDDVLMGQVGSEQRPSTSQLTLDVVSLAELRRLGVPHTDDSLKYEYTLDRDRYGTTS